MSTPDSQAALVTVTVPDGPRRGPRRRTRPILALAGGLAVLGLVAGAVVGGWAAANTAVVARQPNPEPSLVRVALPEYEPGVSARMPDVRGLDKDEATQVIANAGIPVSLVSITQRPAAGPSGVVVQQAPVFGSTNPGAVALIISTPATVPTDALGADAAQVARELEALGARVLQKRQYVPGATVGHVVALAPAPGQPVPATVTLTVADAPSVVELGDLQPIQGYASTDSDVLVGGKDYARAVRLSAAHDGTTTVWSLRGAVTTVNGSLGIEDGASGSPTLRVSVAADGVPVATTTITPGAVQDFCWGVAGATALSITVTSLNDDGADLDLLQPQLLGSYGAIAGLAK